MGSAKSRARSSSVEEEVEDHSETTKTCCWTGIRTFFSKSKRPKSMALHVMEDDTNNNDDNDDVILVNDSSKSSAASIQSAAAIEPRALQKSWSAPAVLGQDCHQSLMPALSSKGEDELPSTSYPKDARVPSQCFLSYHRFINDEENDDESVSSDIEHEDKDGVDADVESNADDDKTPVPGLVYSQSEYTDDDYTGDQEAEDEIKDAIDESSEDETSSQTDQTVMVKEYGLVQITNVTVKDETDENTCSIYPSCSSKESDVTSDDDTTSQVVDVNVFVGKIVAIFVIFLISDLIRTAFYGVYQAGHWFVHEIEMGNEGEIHVDEEKAVVVSSESADGTPRGHREKYPDFTFDIWAYIRNACDSVYQTGLQFVQDIVIGEDDDEMDVDEGCTVVGTEEAGDRITSGCPERQSDYTSNLWAVINNISSIVSQFIYDIMKEEGEEKEDEQEKEEEEEREEDRRRRMRWGRWASTSMRQSLGKQEIVFLKICSKDECHPEYDFGFDVETDAETDSDQSSTSYKRDLTVT